MSGFPVVAGDPASHGWPRWHATWPRVPECPALSIFFIARACIPCHTRVSGAPPSYDGAWHQCAPARRRESGLSGGPERPERPISLQVGDCSELQKRVSIAVEPPDVAIGTQAWHRSASQLFLLLTSCMKPLRAETAGCQREAGEGRGLCTQLPPVPAAGVCPGGGDTPSLHRTHR